VYGFSILVLLLRLLLHRAGVWKQRQFESLSRRYSGSARREDHPVRP
jgi:hypothetical protein